MKKAGISDLHLEGPAIDDAALEKVRSKHWGSAFKRARETTEVDPWAAVEFAEVENAQRKVFDAAAGVWKEDELVEVKMGAKAVDKGSIRECFQCKVRPKEAETRTEAWESPSKNHFAKRFLPERGIPEEAALDDVQLQMTAKFYGDEFNKWLPPKRIDFLYCFVLRMHERPGAPLYFVERFLDKGEFEKHNSNAGYVAGVHDEAVHRNTPQAFSHFTFEQSGGRLMVVDIQGIDDLYTDPAIHSYNGVFGDADLGVKGMALFFHSYGKVADNPVSQFLCLPDLENPDELLFRTENEKSGSREVEYQPKAWIAAPHRQRSATLQEHALSRTSTAGTLPETGQTARSSLPKQNSLVSPKVRLGESGEVLSSPGFGETKTGEAELSTPDFLSKPIPPRPEILAEIYAETADLHDSGRFDNTWPNPDESPEAMARKGRTAMACMKKAVEQGGAAGTKAAITLADFFGGSDTAGRLTCCAGVIEQDAVTSMRYRIAAAKMGNQPAMLTVAAAAARGDHAPAPAYDHAARWYEMALEGGEWEEQYLCQAALADLLTKGGHGLVRDGARASELYTLAAEAAMNLGKGKLSMRYQTAAETCLEDPEPEPEPEPQPQAVLDAAQARKARMAKLGGASEAPKEPMEVYLHRHGVRAWLESELNPSLAGFGGCAAAANPMEMLAEKCRAKAAGYSSSEEGVGAWLRGAVAQLGAEQPAEPLAALAELCRERARSHATSAEGVAAWLEKALAELGSEQPSEPLAALAAKCKQRAAEVASTPSDGGAVSAYGVVAVDLAAELRAARMTQEQVGWEAGSGVGAQGKDQPPPTAMKHNPVTGEMEKFESEALKDDLPEEEEETGDVELPCGDDY